MGRYLDEKEKQLIINLHLKNKFTTEIARITGRNQSTIERFLKREGYKLHKKGKLTQKEEDFIISEYKNGKTCVDIYKEHFKDYFNSSSMIERVVRKNGISRGRYAKPVVLDEDYFEIINNERKAYWLGMLLADGSVIKKSDNSYQIKLELMVEDKYIINEFVKDIKSDLEVKDYRYGYENRKAKHNAVVMVYSVKMANDLSKYGIVSRKTFKDNHIPNIPEGYLSHFIRGYFDGDGGISLIKPKGQNLHRASISFCADETLSIDLKNLLSDKLNIESKIIDMKKYGNNILSVRFAKNEYVKIFYNYIYKDATIFLKRKKEKFETFLEERK